MALKSQNIKNFFSKKTLAPIKNKSIKQQKIGLEMEMHVFDADTLAPLGTEHCSVAPQELLQRIADLLDNCKIQYDVGTNLIIMINLPSGASFSMEPGGQLEYSSAPLETIEAVVQDVVWGLQIIEQAAQGKLLFLSHGTNPISTSKHPLVLPKKRYQVMTRFFRSGPSHHRDLDMMYRSASIQVNLDIAGDAEWQEAVNLTLILITITAGMFANAAYFNNVRSKFLSEREDIWRNADPTRAGIPPGLLFAKDTALAYAQWASIANVFLVESLPLEEQPKFAELTFARWFEQGDYKGVSADLEAWKTHLTTLFPSVRLKNFLEIRHVDALPYEHSMAPAVLFSTLLQSAQMRAALWEFLKAEKINLQPPATGPKDYSNLHLKLINFAEKAVAPADIISKNVLRAYKKFMQERENYWHAASGLDFVKKVATPHPAQDFQKYLYAQH